VRPLTVSIVGRDPGRRDTLLPLHVQGRCEGAYRPRGSPRRQFSDPVGPAQFDDEAFEWSARGAAWSQSDATRRARRGYRKGFTPNTSAPQQSRLERDVYHKWTGEVDANLERMSTSGEAQTRRRREIERHQAAQHVPTWMSGVRLLEISHATRGASLEGRGTPSKSGRPPHFLVANARGRAVRFPPPCSQLCLWPKRPRALEKRERPPAGSQRPFSDLLPGRT